MANQYDTILIPLEVPNRINTYLIQRPTFVSFADMNISFSIFEGQAIRIRETIKLSARRTLPHVSHVWMARPFDEAFLGQYIITKELEDNDSWSTISEKAIGQRNKVDGEVFDFSYNYEWTLNLYASPNENRATQSLIKACNAELRPAAVENTEITVDNALAYAKILLLLRGKKLGEAATAIGELSKPVTAGYRFPDGVVFTSTILTPRVKLNTGNFVTRIGDLYIYLEPDWEIIEEAKYDIRTIDIGSILPLPIEFQFPQTVTCQLPENKPQFPVSGGCYVDFQSFLFSTQDAYPSYSQAVAGRFLKGIDADRKWVIDEKEYLCPNDNADVYTYWKLRQVQVGICEDEFSFFIASLNTRVGRGNTQALSIADFRSRNPSFSGTDADIQSGINNIACSIDPSRVLVIWTAISSIGGVEN